MKQFIRTEKEGEITLLSLIYEPYKETMEEVLSFLQNMEENKPAKPCKDYKRKLKYYKDKLKEYG